MNFDDQKKFVPTQRPKKIIIGPTLRAIMIWCVDHKQHDVIKIYQDSDLEKIHGIKDVADRLIILGYPMDYYHPELRKFVDDFFKNVGNAIL